MGTICDLRFPSDTWVKAGEILGWLECMKLMIEIIAPLAGRVQWLVDRAQVVSNGEILGWMIPEEKEPPCNG